MNLPRGNTGDILLQQKTVREAVRGIPRTMRQDESLGKQLVLKGATGSQDSIAERRAQHAPQRKVASGCALFSPPLSDEVRVRDSYP